MAHRAVWVLSCCLVFGLAGCNLPSLLLNLTPAAADPTQTDHITPVQTGSAATTQPVEQPLSTIQPTEIIAQSEATNIPEIDPTLQEMPCNRIIPGNPVDI
ncbi:MAG: hypothetical protein ABFD44_04865, partial [Anaerolineaceae bacterium]